MYKRQGPCALFYPSLNANVDIVTPMSATTVLLLHGLGGNAAVWDGVRGALGDVPVLTPDLPGHADGPRLARYDIGLMAASLAAQLDPTPVSYTHLDVYKRQAGAWAWAATRASAAA